jgi:hypothetical protein
MLFLGETEREALNKYEVCESRHGRTPISND